MRNLVKEESIETAGEKGEEEFGTETAQEMGEEGFDIETAEAEEQAKEIELLKQRVEQLERERERERREKCNLEQRLRAVEVLKQEKGHKILKLEADNQALARRLSALEQTVDDWIDGKID